LPENSLFAILLLVYCAVSPTEEGKT
jgi:hypothetical protein